MKTKNMVLCAIFAAALCVFSVITVPIGPVPITMGILGVLLTASILGWKRGTISVLVYILLGAVGLPIFSGFKGGIQVILGPTGGYISSYILVSIIVGLLTRRLAGKKLLAMAQIFGASVLGIVVCYFFGTLQFMFVQHMGVWESLGLCVFPFVPFDIIKALITGYLAFEVRRALTKAGMPV